jgi:hypothetical protein
MAVITSKKLAEIQDQIIDLGWEAQRMSSSGLETYNKLCKTFKIEPIKITYNEDSF